MSALNQRPAQRSDRLNVQVHRLDNGLTVYLSPTSEEPRISARVVVRAGSAQDPPDATGMAHYLEHLLANKGTRKLGTTNWEDERPHLDEVRALYDRLFAATDESVRASIYAEIHQAGARANQYAIQNELKQLWGVLGGRRLNAFTSTDITAYVVDLPANRLQHWAMIEGDRFRHPVFRSFQTEVETVYEEKNRSLDSPQRAPYEALRAKIYAGLPYANSTLGRVDHLKNPCMSKTEAFFQDWYVPSNMAVILAGDFDPEQALAWVNEHLGALENRGPAERVVTELAPLEGEVLVDVVHRGRPEVYVAWRTVPFGHPDHPCLVVADSLLANGANGLIDRNLNHPKVLRGATAWHSAEALAGMQVVYGQPRAQQTLSDVQSRLLSQVHALREGDFDDADLAAVATQARLGEKGQLESPASRVNMLTLAFRHQLPWSYVRDWADQLARVTRDDVVRVARQYLGEDRIVVHKAVGEPTLPVIRAPSLPPLTINTERHSDFYQEVANLPAASLPVQKLREGEHYQRRMTTRGPLYTVVNPYSDLFEIRFTWDVGYHQDPTLPMAWRLWDFAGLRGSDRAAFETWRYRSGVDVSTQCGRYASSLVIRGEGAAFDDALTKIRERILHPTFQGTELSKLIDDTVLTRQEEKATPPFQIKALASYALEGDQSSWLSDVLSDDALRSLKTEALSASLQRLWRTQATVTYVGTLPIDEVQRRVIHETACDVVEPRPRFRWFEPKTSRILLLDQATAQTTVRLGDALSPLGPRRMART